MPFNVLSVDENLRQDLNLFDCFGKHKRKFYHFESVLCSASYEKIKYLAWFGKPGHMLSIVLRSWAVILSKKCTVILLVAIKYNATLDADLQSSRVTSRGLFKENNERYMQRDVVVRHEENCVHDMFSVQVSAIASSLV